MPLIVGVTAPTTPTLSGLLLPDRIAGSATARATAITITRVVAMKTRVLARNRSSRRATSQVTRSEPPGRAVPGWLLAAW